MKKPILFAFLCIISNMAVYSQYVFFEEDFEGGTIPAGWSESQEGPSAVSWRYEDGGHSTNPSIPNSRRPNSAYQGSFNALFEASLIDNSKTKLITPEIDLSIAIKPELHFWYANYQRDILSINNDKIRVYYRSIDENTYDWVLLYEITDSYSEWTEATILIPDSVRFTNVEIAFEGEIGPGWGACIDSLTLIETGIIPKYLDEIKVQQASILNTPSGSKNNPILRLDLTVKGNDGQLHIDSLIVDALDYAQDAVETNGVKLFFTNSTHFLPSNQVGDAVSFLDGKAIIKNTDIDIPFGYSYLWITFDIKDDPSHTLNNLNVDAKILKDNLIINSLKYPFSDLNPSGNRKVVESIFYDGFENTTTWNLTEEFEIDIPGGLGGGLGYPDPDNAYNGDKVLGVDLTGIGSDQDSEGNYENNLDYITTNYATSEVINCKYYKDIHLNYYRWLNVEHADSAIIQISMDNLTSWKNAWRNSQLINENKWNQQQLSVIELADREENINARYVLGPTNNNWAFSGWNIDDFNVTGTFVHTDAGVTAWIGPDEGCGHVAPEAIVATVKNFGYNEITSGVLIGFSTDGGETWTTETISSTFAQDEEIEYTFTNLIDLTVPGEHNVLVKTFLTGDQDNRNDQIEQNLYISPTKTLPYSENFESNDGYWLAGGNETWEYGIPKGDSLSTSSSGYYAWATNLEGDYPDSDSSWIESPCFDFSGVEKPIFEIKIASKTEVNNDGLALYYSIDEGENWSFVPKVDSYDWNWYNNTISAHGTEGWDSVVEKGFWMARQTLPVEVSDISPVKFRLLFKSNDTITNEGFVIDDIRIYDAPTDAGVIAINSPTNSCDLTASESINFEIQNYGIRKFTPSDDLIATLEVDGEYITTETFNVSSNIDTGSSTDFTFSSTVDLSQNGSYNIKIYTEVDGDSNMYTVNNDTLNASIEMWGEPNYTLGPDIGTEDPEAVTLDAGSGYTYYSWSTGLEGASENLLSLTGLGEGTYSVTVTNSNACEASDEINVIASITDLSVTNITGISSACIESISPAIEITILNNGDTNYHTSDVVQVGYQIDDEPKVVENITLSDESFIIGASMNYTFIDQPEFETAGDKEIKCFTIFEPELDYGNDTVTTTITITELPVIDLGEDTIYSDMASPILLDAGAGYSSYLWQDASTNQTFEINSTLSQEYKVEAIAANGCGTAKDSVWLFSDDWELDTIFNPANTCYGSTSNIISLRLYNNSDNIYPVGVVIPVKLNFQGTIVYEDIITTNIINDKSYYNHNLSTTLDNAEPDSYFFSANILPSNDIDSLNNSEFKEFQTFETPTVDLGADTIFTTQADTILLDASDKFTIYEWETGHTTQTYQIPIATSELYKVTVTDAHACKTSSDSVQILATDVAIDDIVSPRSTCSLTNTNTISFVLHNYGNDVILAGTNMSVFYNYNNEGFIEKTFTLPYNLNPDKTKTISISQDLEFDSSETYDFSLVINYDQDFFNNNDTLSTTIFEFGQPEIDLGEDIYTSQPDTVTLQAQEGFTDYLWQDLSRENSFNVTYGATAKYHCQVQSAYGCTASDTVNVITYNLGIESVADLNNCDVQNSTVGVNICIASKDTLQSGDSIKAYYTFEGSTIEELIILDDTLTNGRLLTHEFSTQLSITDAGDYSIKCFLDFNGDFIPNNDTLEVNFTIGTTQVDLGDDLNLYSTSYTLNAGAGFSTYLWDDTSTEQTRLINSSGLYSVTTTDAIGCESYDDINVLFLTPQYDITEIFGLENSCLNPTPDAISFTLKNTGNDTIFADSIIPISYIINVEEEEVNETYTFASNFIPGASVNIAFSTKANLSEPNEYTISVSATFGSSSSTNDSTVNTWGLPDIDLGDDFKSVEETVELDAGEGFTSYLWSTTDETEEITVSESGIYSVTISSEHGCYNSDTIKVTFVSTALEVSQFIGPTEGCLPLNTEKAIIKIRNYGGRVIPSGTNIGLGYSLSGQARVDENIEISNMVPDATYTHEFGSFLNTSETGTVDIQFYIKVEGIDVDTANYDITVNESPEFSFGSDTIKVTEYPYTLDPEIEAESYLWSTDATTPTIIINNDGHYWLAITNENNCSFADTVYVENITSISSEWTNSINIYPNPAKEKLFIEIPNRTDETIVEFVDYNGKKLIFTKQIQNKNEFDISNWSQGVYFVRIYNQNNYAMFKLVVQ